MKLRKAILTGGGRATRLRPITTTINKHLIPLANKPMIFHAIEKAVALGVEEIYINVNPGETQLQKYIGDGGHWGVKIVFFEQEDGPQGIAHVVKCAQKFIGHEPFLFFLSDNILLGSLEPLLKKFTAENADCLLAFAKVPDPQRFGVPVFDDRGKLINVIEKPAVPPNDFAQTGIYFYGPDVFFKAFDHIKKSARGEYEISDIHSYLLEHGNRVVWQEVTGWWKDTGKPEDLITTNTLLLDEMTKNGAPFALQGSVAPDTELQGPVHIGAGTRVGKGVKLRGPVIVGENCVLENCTVGPHVTVGTGCSIKQATIETSILFSGAAVETPITVVNSIIGEQARVVPHGRSGTHRLIIGDHTLIEM